jgi:phosphoribosylglycinamide formyltransferase-1
MKKIAVFASGTGSNFEAIVNAVKTGEIKEAVVSILVCDNPNAKVIQKAKSKSIYTHVFNPKEYISKAIYEKEIVSILDALGIDLIVLAGYMRLIGETILKEYNQKIINIHPSLLPKYKGLDAVGQALKAKDTVTGVTVHYVDQGMDTGAIIKQQSVVIKPNESRTSLEAKIHHIEHQMYKQVINQILKERIK